MAGKGTITLSFVLNADGKGFKALAKDAEGFKKVIASTVTEAEKFKPNLINFAAIAVGIDQATQAVQQLHGVMAGLSASYAVQVEGETKLATVMRQRMQATDAEIESIKQLASAQQELGIVGDEVQLAGAQQLATFVGQKSSLETLLPAMNNLIAQQRGVNASTSDAVAVANRFGKAMLGRAAELREVGITLSETEEQMIKYGDETQRATILAQVITNNVGNMNAELAKTDVGKQKQLENALGDIKEVIGGKIQWAMPYVTMAASATTALGGVSRLLVGVRTATLAVTKWTLYTRASALVAKLKSSVVTGLAVRVRLLGSALQGGAYRALALKVALRGLLMASGVGIAFAALGFVVSKLIDKFDSVGDSAQGMADEINNAKEASERASKAYADTNADTYSRLMTKYSELKAQWSALSNAHQKTQWLKNSRDAFEELGLEVNNAKDAEVVFSGNTDAVVAAFQARAKAAANLARLTALYSRQLELSDRIGEADEKAQRGADKVRRMNAGDLVTEAHGDFIRRHSGEDGLVKAKYYGRKFLGHEFTAKGAALHNAEIGKANGKEYKADKAELAQVNTKIAQASATAKADAEAVKSKVRIAPKKEETKKNDKKDDKDKIIANAKSYAQLSHNLGVYKRRLEEADPANTTLVASLRKQIDETERAAQAAKDMADGLNLSNPRTLEEVDEAISRLQTKMRKADKERLAEYSVQEKQLQSLKKEIEGMGYVPPPIEAIHTYEELSKAVSYYEEALKTADAVGRKSLSEKMHQLAQLRAQWDDAREVIERPADIGQLKTAEELSKAISYYRDLQGKANADEVADLERTINALERKEHALKRGIDIMGWQKEVAQVNELSGREYKVKVRGFGFDELTAKIKELNTLLSDTENPLTERQRQDIQGLISAYEDWRRTGVRSIETLSAGWDSLKGISSSIAGMSDALSGNANAWQAITAVVDGALQIYQGVQGVISLIGMLTAVSRGNAVAESAGATATIANTTAQASQMALAPAQIATNNALTASVMKFAAAQYMAAHASIPFAGVGIATAQLATAKTAVAMAGAIPFAKGGIVSGPTFALVGEYAGARNNPEVIAPLDKLRSMIEPSGSVGGHVRFEIEGRKLVGVIANETRIGSKSGRRSNIKI